MLQTTSLNLHFRDQIISNPFISKIFISVSHPQVFFFPGNSHMNPMTWFRKKSWLFFTQECQVGFWVGEPPGASLFIGRVEQKPIWSILLGIFVANFSEPTPPFFLRWGRWGSIKTYGNLIGFSRGTMTLTRIESLPLILNTIYINGSFLMCLSPLLNLGFWGGVEY